LSFLVIVRRNAAELRFGVYQWRRSVVLKYRAMVSQVKPSNCFRRLEKLVLRSIFDISLSSFMTWNLQSYPTTVLTERMWHFFLGGGVNKTYSGPPAYFRDQDPQVLWPTSLASIILSYLSSVTPDAENNPGSCELRFKLDPSYGNFRVWRPCWDVC